MGNLVLDGRLADVRVILLAFFAAGGIDHQFDFTVFNGIGNVRPAIPQLEDQFGLNTVFIHKLMGPFGCKDPETQVPEEPGRFKCAGLVRVRDGDQDASLKGQ